MIQLILTLKMTTAQVVETSVTVNNNSPIQDYVHSDDQTQPTFDIFFCSACPSVGLNLSYIAIRQNKVIKNYQRYYSDYHLFSPSLDIDECSNKTHTCDVNAICSNTQGSHNCTCKPGYSGDGKKCIAVGMQHPYRMPMILSIII